jgi:hypothetical protein
MTTPMNSTTAPAQTAVDRAYRIAQLEAELAEVWAVAAACVQEHHAETAFAAAIESQYQDDITRTRTRFALTATIRRKTVDSLPLALRMRLEQA